MNKIITVILSFILIVCVLSCNRYDTKKSMQLKCENLRGLNELVLNKTTVDDIFQNYDTANVRENTCCWLRPNINHDYTSNYSNFNKKALWTALRITKYDNNFWLGAVELEFYNDTLVQISYRYDSNAKRLLEFFVNNYGFGIPVNREILEKILITNKDNSTSDESFFAKAYYDGKTNLFRKYENKDVCMIINSEYWDVLICYVPKIKLLSNAIKSEYKSSFSSESSYSSEKVRGYGTMNADDDEYWESVNREEALKKAGLDDAAKIERRARIKYLQGDGYTSPNGGSQIHYQGSKEQQEHLEEMKRRGW